MIWLTQAFRITPAILLMIGSGLLGACGSDADEPSARETHAAHQAKKRIDQPKKVDVDADMVVAPSTAKSRAPVTLKFAITQKPQVGAPVDVRLALIPTAELQQVVGSFLGSEGLELRSGAKTPTFEKPEVGTSINHTITVVPSSDGIFYVTATLVSDADSTSVSRTFTIPLIVGEGLSAPQKPAQAAPTAVANAPAAKSRQSP
jgi:hypothetical protein